MEQTTFFECSGLTSMRTLRDIKNETQLDVPASIAIVADELAMFFSGTDWHHLVVAMLATADLRMDIEDRARSMYTTSESFRIECKRPQATSYFEGFVRTWVADALKTRYPDLYRKLPGNFRAAGMPIPKNKRA